MSKLSKLRKNRTLGHEELNAFDRMMQGYARGSMSEKVAMIEKENPFKNNNPSYIEDPFERVNRRFGQTTLFGEVQKVFEKPRSEEWENKTVDINGPVFNKEAEKLQKERLHQTAMKYKETHYKDKNPESEEIPRGRLDYTDNLFQKMADANAKALKEALNPTPSKERFEIEKIRREMAESQLKASKEQGIGAFYAAQQKQQELQAKVQKIAEQYESDEAKYRNLGIMSATPEFITEDLIRLKRKRAQEEIDELSK